jgi:outer membrane protein OmpA-like peptidoglycan-associated protein
MRSRRLGRRGFIAGLSLAGLAACDFNRPAGSAVDEGGFGAATMRNMRVMDGSAAVAHLGTRFADAVPTTINFPFDSAALTPTARAVLDRQADFMRQFPELRFSVYGHTDLVGSDRYNVALGRRRAAAVVAYLGARGVAAARLDALVSFGETRPLVPTRSPEPANRRTVTEVAGFVSAHPLVLDGKYAQIVYRAYVAGAASAAGP